MSRTVSGVFRRLAMPAVAVCSFALILPLAAPEQAWALQIGVVSTDPYTNTTSYHATEVEADSASLGSTIASVFQAGRFADGGASNLGWATSADGGRTWQHGFLPSTTIYATPPGPWQRITDPAVTVDRKHGRFLIVGLVSDALSMFVGRSVIVSGSTDGVHWSAPVTVATTSTGSFDSTWIGCDTFTTSPTYGACYVEFDDHAVGNQIHISRSTDGGATWAASQVPSTSVLHGEPLVQPNGRVIVPITDGALTQVESFVSSDGGLTFTGPFLVSTISLHIPAGGIRSLDVVTADEDASGRVFVAWYDDRFRPGGTSNDLVLSTSTDGKTWTTPVRIPIDPVSSTVDHFLPGLGVRPGTSGATAALGLAFYYYPTASCTVSTCQLDYAMTVSTDGGATWKSARQLAGPMTLTWLPNTTSGYMVGDYSNATWAGSHPESVLAVASSGTCQLGVVGSCHEAMDAIQYGVVSGSSLEARAGPVRYERRNDGEGLQSMH